jgi:hypothetical protein
MARIHRSIAAARSINNKKETLMKHAHSYSTSKSCNCRELSDSVEPEDFNLSASFCLDFASISFAGSREKQCLLESSCPWKGNMINKGLMMSKIAHQNNSISPDFFRVRIDALTPNAQRHPSLQSTAQIISMNHFGICSALNLYSVAAAATRS